MNRPLVLTALAGLALATNAQAQIVVNEVYSNPPGSGSIDDRWEYLEIYGPAGMNLTGYMLASVFGGGDPNGNNIPGPLPAGWDGGDEVGEIDEAWTLDGLTIGSNGLLVIYNNNGLSAGRPSFIPSFFAPGTTGVTFDQSHVPTVDVAGRVKNDGSATFVILRKRPFHTVNAQGVSVYDGVPGNTIVNGPLNYPSNIRYGWRKDVNPDVDYNGRIDFAGIGALIGGSPNPPEVGVNSERAATPPVGSPWQLEPYQMVDDVAWSNGGGKEYVRSSQQELSDTAGFNPDAVSRVAYYGTNPARGSVFVASEMKPSRTADEEFIYGDVLDSPPLIRYNVGTNQQTDVVGGPTDPAGPFYNALGQLDPQGTNRLDDINLAGFTLTPGAFNDVNGTSSGGIQVTQFRFVTGDFNFDGVVNCQDRALINQRRTQNASLDDTDILTDDRNTSDNLADDIVYTGWKWQGRSFNALLAMVRMNLTDGTTGEWNSGTTITAADVAAFTAIFNAPCCPADLGQQGCVPGSDGVLNNNDFVVFIDYFFAANPLADKGLQGGIAGQDGLFNNNDFVVFIDQFFGGCQ